MSAKRARERRRSKGLAWARERLLLAFRTSEDNLHWFDYGAFQARYPWLPAPRDAYTATVTWYGNVRGMP